MKNAIRTLMTELVDYAGLFPPAEFAMDEAVRRYASYATEGIEASFGLDAPMLGRFIVPAARLEEFATVIEAEWVVTRQCTWRLTLLASGDAEADRRAVERLMNHERASSRVVVEGLELLRKEQIEPARLDPMLRTYASMLGRVQERGRQAIYVESSTAALPALIPVLRAHGLGAKLRMGGVTPEAIPSCAEVANFVAQCAAAKIPIKATAGLHHALRGEHPLTSAPDAPVATMHGYLNLLTAVLLAEAGAPQPELEAALLSASAADFTLTPESFRWREHRFGVHRLAALRRHGVVGFGSCSFLEPVETLAALVDPRQQRETA